MIYKHLLALIIVIAFVSCKKEVNDDEKPEIITTFLSTSTPQVGTQLKFSADISDNYLIGSYKIYVVDNFGFTADSIEETNRLWHLSVTEIENQNVHTINNYTINIPTTASAGPYSLTLTVLDSKGNESAKKELYFEVINNTNQPTISIIEPVVSSVYNQGDTIYVGGTIQDDIAIEEISFNANNSNGTFFNQSIYYDTIITTSFDVVTDGNIKIALPAVSGDYSLTTSVKDTVGNFKIKTTNFTVN
jgi:hypothetical protein